MSGRKTNRSSANGQRQQASSSSRLLAVFNRGIQRIASTVYPGLTLDRKAKKLASVNLKNLGTALVQKAADQAADHDELLVEHLYHALSEVLDDDLLSHALGNVSRCLTLYADGMLKFGPTVIKKKVPKTRLRASVRVRAKSARRKISPGKKKKGVSKRKSSRRTKPSTSRKTQKSQPAQSGNMFNKGIKEVTSRKEAGRPHIWRKDMIFRPEVPEFMINDAARRCQDKLDEKSADAAKDIFPEDMMAHATANGSNYVSKLENGILDYKPSKPRVGGKRAGTSPRSKKGSGGRSSKRARTAGTKRKSSAKEPPKPSSMFTKAVKKMLADLNDHDEPPKFTVKPNTQEMLNDILYNTGDFLANRIAENSRNKNLPELDSEQVVDVVKDIFPQDLMQHALCAGRTRLAQFNSESTKTRIRETHLKIGFMKLNKMRNPDTLLDKSYTDMVSKILLRTAVKIIEKSLERNQTFESAVAHVLPEEIGRQALQQSLLRQNQTSYNQNLPFPQKTIRKLINQVYSQREDTAPLERNVCRLMEFLGSAILDGTIDAAPSRKLLIGADLETLLRNDPELEDLFHRAN